MKTEIVKANRSTISKAVLVLQKGGIIIYPTETCYGIGADATSNKAVLKVIKIKKRQKEKRLPIAMCDIAMAKKYVVMTKEAEMLAKTLMPGPLTLVVESKKKTSIGFRIPDNKFVLRFIRKFGKPITTTSANLAGQKPLYSIKDIVKTFDGKVDLIIDAGNLPRRKPSTVFELRTGRVLRKGPISEKEILMILKGL